MQFHFNFNGILDVYIFSFDIFPTELSDGFLLHPANQNAGTVRNGVVGAYERSQHGAHNSASPQSSASNYGHSTKFFTTL